MKQARGFIVAMLVLFACMMLIETLAPRHFKWDATYAHASDEPFGCALFDSVMETSLRQGYSTTSLTLSQLEKTMPASERHIYLMITEDRPMNGMADEVAMLNMLKRGDCFIVASGSWYSDSIEEVLNVRAVGFGVSVWALKSSYLNKENDTLTWIGDTLRYPPKKWIVPNELSYHYTYLEANNGHSPIRPLLTRGYFQEEDYELDYDSVKHVLEPAHVQVDTMAGIMEYGKGKLIVSVVPTMFSNYGLIYCDGATLALRMMSQFEEYPVIRLDRAAKTEVGGVSESPLRYVISQPPMKWAMWLLIVAVLLAMVFTARRRQRVIPVIEPPINRALEMVKHIGSLYFQRHDNADLMAKKYQFFVEELRKLTMIDLDDEAHIDDAYLQLQQASGIPRDELRQQLQAIADATVNPVKDKQLMRHIDYLNHILTKLK